jgi:hypothetical protein
MLTAGMSFEFEDSDFTRPVSKQVVLQIRENPRCFRVIRG